VTFWTAERVKILHDTRGSGITNRALAARLGCTTAACAGAIARFVHGKQGCAVVGPKLVASAWDESRLTERWADRKARLARERGQMEMAA
jgi:hypothetical protein